MTIEILSTITETRSNRRGLLGLMAKALALTTIPATAALASDEARALEKFAETKENPELLTLDEALCEARSKLANATTRYYETAKIGNSMWPRAPEIIIAPHWHETRERDIGGAAFTCIGGPFDEEIQVRRYSTKDLEREKPNEPRKRRSRKPETLAKVAARYAQDLAEYEQDMVTWNARYAAASAYEAETDRVRDASGFTEARKAYYKATADLRKICNDISGLEAATLEDLAIKASAINAWMETRYGTLLDSDCTDWGNSLIANMLRIDGRDTSAIDESSAIHRKVAAKDVYRWEEQDPSRYDNA